LPIIVAVSSAHLLNDTIQSLLPALYPVLKDELHITFAQVGLITLTFQLTASLLQPFVGLYTDRHPQPFSLAAGMVFTLGGVALLSVAHTFALVLIAAALIGFGSSIFHPEASRVARLASGDATVSLNRSSKSGATRAAPSARSSPRSLSPIAPKRTSRGFPCSRLSASLSSPAWDAGIGIISPTSSATRLRLTRPPRHHCRRSALSPPSRFSPC
jgi:FSR family fosmidomycin resistance protein-like MFS transporter